VRVKHDEAEGDVRSFELVFEAQTCDECGDTNPVSRTCRCGAWIPRDDEHVARRRAATAEARALLAAPVVPSIPVPFSDAIDLLVPWFARFFDGLRILGGSGADGTLVATQVGTLVGLRSRAAAVPRRRPWLALWDPLGSVLDALMSMAETELAAATASNPEAAQALEAVGQGHLNHAAAQIGVVNDRLDWWGLNKTIGLPDSLITAAVAAYDSTGAQNLLDLDRRGMARYERISGKATGPAGIGVGLLLDLGLADRTFDEDRVFRVARTVYERVDRHRAGFLGLVADAGWRADLLHARRVFYEAQLTTETLLRELAGDRRVEAGAVMQLGSKLTERVSAALVGLAVAADRRISLKRTADYSVVHGAARAAGLGDLLLGFDARIRNADAHADFDIADDHVVLGRNHGRPERVSDEDLVDIVLAAVESCAAIFAAIDCVLVEEGHPAAQDRLGDIPVEDLLRIMLAASGVGPGRLEIRGDRLEVSGAALGALAVNPLSVIASLSSVVPATVRRLTLRLRRRDGPVVADVVLEPLRRSQGLEDGLAKDVAFIEFLGRATLNGRRVLSQRHVRFLIAYNCVPVLGSPLGRAEPALGVLAAAARRLKDQDLAEALDAALAMKRAQEGGPPAPPHVRRTFERLATYVGTPPGPWNDGSGGSGPMVPS